MDVAIESQAPAGGLRILVKQIQPEVMQPGLLQHRERFHSGLRRAVEQRVATAEIGSQRLLNTAAVGQQHGVTLAGPAAVGVIVNIGQQGTK